MIKLILVIAIVSSGGIGLGLVLADIVKGTGRYGLPSAVIAVSILSIGLVTGLTPSGEQPNYWIYVPLMVLLTFAVYWNLYSHRERQ